MNMDNAIMASAMIGFLVPLAIKTKKEGDLRTVLSDAAVMSLVAATTRALLEMGAVIYTRMQ